MIKSELTSKEKRLLRQLPQRLEQLAEEAESLKFEHYAELLAVHLSWSIGFKVKDIVYCPSPNAMLSNYQGLFESDARRRTGFPPMQPFARRISDKIQRVGYRSFSREILEEVTKCVIVPKRVAALQAAFRASELSAHNRTGRRLHLARQWNLIASNDFEWLASASFLYPIIGVENGWESLLKLHYLTPCMASHGQTLLICKPPVTIKTDAAGRVHCEDGPALEFPDGSQYNAVGGVILLDDIFHSNYQFSAAEILLSENAEVRRVLTERVGIDSLLQMAEASLVSQDDFGSLYRIPRAILPDWRDGSDDDYMYLKLLNSTPEPDDPAHFKEYLLRVPPNMKTPKQAVAWTFGMQADDYAPLLET